MKKLIIIAVIALSGSTLFAQDQNRNPNLAQQELAMANLHKAEQAQRNLQKERDAKADMEKISDAAIKNEVAPLIKRNEYPAPVLATPATKRSENATK